MNEEERAALYRQQRTSRLQARRDRYVGLAGNRDSRVALDAAWMPRILVSLEAQGYPDDCIDSEECLYVEVPPEDVYITEIPDDLLV